MIFPNLKKIIIYIFAILLSSLFILITTNYLFTQEQPQYTIIRGMNNLKSSSLEDIIEENSNFEENLFTKEGKASYYGRKFHNRKTASGEKYDMHKLSAAHKSLPFGTILKITNTANNLTTFIRINDRGPFIRKRYLDLSYQSALSINGLGLPTIYSEGFLPNNLDGLDTSDLDYFLAYSYSYKPLVIESKYLDITSTYYDFDSAVESYNFRLAAGELDSNDSFLAIDTDKYGLKNDQDVYYIAKYRAISHPKIPVMMAEKIYNK